MWLETGVSSVSFLLIGHESLLRFGFLLYLVKTHTVMRIYLSHLQENTPYECVSEKNKTTTTPFGCGVYSLRSCAKPPGEILLVANRTTSLLR